MFKTILAATAALTMVSGVVLAADVSTTETTRQSTGIGPLKLETDKTVRTNEGMAAPGHVEVDKQKSVTKDWDGDTTTKTKTESTTVR